MVYRLASKPGIKSPCRCNRKNHDDTPPLDLHRKTVRPEWIDYNGHMNVAYYVLAFDHATDVFFHHLGLSAAHRAATGSSTFAVESHITYLSEVAAGDPLRFTSQAPDPRRQADPFLSSHVPR